MPVVLEFSSGGPYAHVACAPSCIQSRLIEQGNAASILTIEALAHTTMGGTFFDPGCMVCLSHYGILNQITGDCPAGYIMNPMLDKVVDISLFHTYLAARQGGLDTLIMAGATGPTPPPVPAPPKPPKPVPQEDDDVAYLASAGVRPKGETLDPNGQGAVYLIIGDTKRHIPGFEAAALPQLEAAYGAIKDYSAAPFLLDHGFFEGPPVDNSYPTVDGYTRPAGWQPPGPA